MVQSKHVDFLLCDPKSLLPVLAIELDDSSHAQERRAKRDDFVDQVLQDAGLPILRVGAKVAYEPRMLAEQIQAMLQTVR